MALNGGRVEAALPLHTDAVAWLERWGLVLVEAAAVQGRVPAGGIMVPGDAEVVEALSGLHAVMTEALSGQGRGVAGHGAREP